MYKKKNGVDKTKTKTVSKITTKDSVQNKHKGQCPK